MRLAALCLVSAPLLASALPRALQPAGGPATSTPGRPSQEETLPSLIIQYGESRTASMLQFQTLCAIALVLNEAQPERVRCSFLPAGPSPPGDLAAKAADLNTLHVVKTHVVPDDGFPNDAWLFASEIDEAVGSDDPWQGAAQRMSGELGHEVKYAQVMSRLAGRGSGIATEYRSFFGLSDLQLEEVVTYSKAFYSLGPLLIADFDKQESPHPSPSPNPNPSPSSSPSPNPSPSPSPNPNP